MSDLGNLKEAELSTRKAIEIKPDFANAFSHLGVILLQKGEHLLSLHYFSESTELLRGENAQGSDQIRYEKISKAKIDHDIEQFEYLASQGYESEKFTALAILYKRIASEIYWPSETQLLSLSNKHQRNQDSV